MNENNFVRPDISYAKGQLLIYKRGKKDIEERISAEEDIWRDIYSGSRSSSWIFNAIVNKHADIIDSIPTSVCLPREKGDEEYAATVSKIIPVIMQRCCFESVYSDNSWEKLKHGSAIYGIFWNGSLEEGLGDIDVKALAFSDVFWDAGARDIQDSKDLFIVKLCDRDEVEAIYDGFIYEEQRESDISLRSALNLSASDDKCLVVDWYYKRVGCDGVSRLHFCKFAGDMILYASESDPEREDGWYCHGNYPVVIDRLYPTDKAYGFGLVSIARAAQDYINRIDEDILGYADWASKVRFWAKRSLGVNEREFLDLGRGIVEVEGDIDEEKLRQIEISPIDESVIDIKKMKIDEIKEVTGSRDVSQGGYSSSVTAASAISILREAGAKSSRDGIEESYRAYVKIVSFMIELIRQFYSEKRVFRIVGEDGGSKFIEFSGKELSRGDGGRVHFDIEVKAMKKSPIEAAQKNEFAKSLFESGAFSREKAEETLMMLEIMDFEGVEKLKATVRSIYESLSSEGVGK